MRLYRAAIFVAMQVGACAALAHVGLAQAPTAPSGWRQHEINRTRPTALQPPAEVAAAPAPSDAVVLFDGRSLAAFETSAGAVPGWKVENGYFEVVPRAGSIRTKESFGDAQIHLEWASPDPPEGTGQNRGNSGVIIMGRYEVQILDSYERADTYADGQAGAVYGQYPPLVNASRPPGQWQSYDIFFRRPRFRPDGSVQEPARITVVHNGILVQNNEVIFAPTAAAAPFAYVAHADEAPLTLQDHSHPVRFRNVWVRRIGERPEPGPGYVPAAVSVSDAEAERIVGEYFRQPTQPAAAAPTAPATPAYTVLREGGQFMVKFGNGAPLRAIPMSANKLWVTERAAVMTFTPGSAGVPTQVSVELNGSTSTAAKP